MSKKIKLKDLINENFTGTMMGGVWNDASNGNIVWIDFGRTGGAHNQRGCVKFSVVASSAIWLEDMIALVESSASSELYSVLKRPDEKLVTERAYDNPVFVEDLVRNVAIKANQLDSIIWYKIEAENFESIHNHNAYAVVIKNRKN